MEPKIKKKSSITEKAIKNQKAILVVAVLCIITLFAGTSYSMLTNFDTYDNNITNIEKNGFRISVNNTKDIVALSGKNVLTDEDGLKTKGVSFTITNNGNKDISNLKVKLVKSKNKKSTLDEKKIKYSISTDLKSAFSEPKFLLDNDNIILYVSNLVKGKSQSIYLKVWVSDTETINNDVYYGSLDFDF